MSLNFSQVKSLTIPEGKAKYITRKSDGLLLWKSGYKNWVPYSTEADGVTIYNGGLGYKNGYRVRSGGAEGASENASCSGFFPLKAGDTVRMSGYDALNAAAENAINVYDSSKTNLGQAVANYANAGHGIFGSGGSGYGYGWNTVVENPSGVYVWVAPPVADIAFMRVTGLTKDGSKMIVTVNEEITVDKKYTNLLDTATKTLNARWNSSNALDTTVGKGTGHVALDYIDVKSGDVLRFKAPGGATDAGANGHSKLLAGGYSRVRYFNASNTLVASNSDAKPHLDFKVTTDSNGVSSIVVGYKNTTAGDDSTNALSSQAGSIVKARIAIYLSSSEITEADLEGAIITLNEEIT